MVRFEQQDIDSELKSEIDAILSCANDARRDRDLLGDFSLAPARHPSDHGTSVHIRAVPLSEADECEFRFDMQLQYNTREPVRIWVERLLEAAAEFRDLTRREEGARSLRRLIEDAITPVADGLHPARLIAVGLKVSDVSPGYQMLVDIETLGENLRMGIHRHRVDDIGLFGAELADLVADHAERKRLRMLADDCGAVGWIDDVALNLVDASSMSRSDLVARLNDQPAIDFQFGGDEDDDYIGELVWDEGVIRCLVGDWAAGWTFDRSEFILRKCVLPETVLVAWQGRRFGDVIEHPLIPGDAVVVRAELTDNTLHVDLELAEQLLK
jgi:hypothetical protein